MNVSDSLKKDLTKTALDIAHSYNVELDFTEDSIRAADSVLGYINRDHVQSGKTEGINGIAMAFAAYIISVIEKNLESGVWERDSEFGQGTFPYILSDEVKIFPVAWCQKRINNGEADNIWAKFQTTVLKREG